VRHSYEVTSELFTLALAIASGAAAGRTGAHCYVVEQGGSSIPCMIVEWGGETEAVAFPVGEMLRFLGLPLPYRGEKS